MLAKWLNVAPRILILDEPTRGIDVGAKADVHQLIDDLARDGVAVIVISSDLPEVLAMSDRIVVMREGRVRGVFTHDEADPERVMAAAVRMRARRRLRPERIKELTLLLLIVATLVVFSLVIDNYLSGRFFNRVTQGVAVTAVMAAGQSLVIITRNIDLSVGSIAGVSAYLTGEVLGDHLATPPVLAVLLAVAIGTLLGLVNGALVAYGRIPSIIVTLGTLAIYRTWLISYAEARTITASSLPQWLVDLPALHGVRHRRVRVPHDVRAGDRRHHRPAGGPGPRPRRADRLRHRLQPGSCGAVRVCPCGARRSPPSRRAERSPGSAGSSCWPASARSPCRPDRGSNSSRSPPRSSAG